MTALEVSSNLKSLFCNRIKIRADQCHTRLPKALVVFQFHRKEEGNTVVFGFWNKQGILHRTRPNRLGFLSKA